MFQTLSLPIGGWTPQALTGHCIFQESWQKLHPWLLDLWVLTDVSPNPCRPSHEAQPLNDFCNRNSPKFWLQPPFQGPEKGRNTDSPLPSFSSVPYSPYTPVPWPFNPRAPKMLLIKRKHEANGALNHLLQLPYHFSPLLTLYPASWPFLLIYPLSILHHNNSKLRASH